jgi:hypothetical protein
MQEIIDFWGYYYYLCTLIILINVLTGYNKYCNASILGPYNKILLIIAHPELLIEIIWNKGEKITK